MKRRKKGIAVLLLLSLALVVLSGCGGSEESQYAGTWELTGGRAGGISLPQEQIKSEVGEASMTIQEDGTVKKTGVGLDENGKWEETDKGITVSDQDGSNAVTFTLADDKLIGTVKGIEMTFSKKK